MAHLLDVFQKIFVINLASRSDRRREMDAQLRRIGLSLSAPRVERFDAVRPEDRGEFPSVGSRGCFLSHLGALEKSVTEGLDRVLILEDDLNFVEDFSARIQPLAERLLEGDWGLFYGGYRLDPAFSVVQGTPAISVPSSQGIGTSHFIGVAGDALPLLVRYLRAQLQRSAGDPAGGPMHVDGSYSWFRRDHPDVLTLLAVPELGYQRPSRTDIHDLRWFDRVRGVRSVVSLLRGLRR